MKLSKGEREKVKRKYEEIKKLSRGDRDRYSCLYYDDKKGQSSIDCPFVTGGSFSRCPTCPIPLKIRNSDKYGDYMYVGERFKGDPLSPINQ